MTPADKVDRFMALTGPYHGRLLRIACAMCQDRELAADLCQETLLKAFKALESFRQEAPVLPWLTRILRNTYIDLSRTSRERHEVAEHRFPPEPASPIARAASRLPSVEDHAGVTELGRMLQEELAHLPASQQLLLVLCDVEGFSYPEAATIAGIPLGTVRSRLARGRALLRQRIAARLGPGEGDSHG